MKLNTLTGHRKHLTIITYSKTEQLEQCTIMKQHKSIFPLFLPPPWCVCVCGGGWWVAWGMMVSALLSRTYIVTGFLLCNEKKEEDWADVVMLTSKVTFSGLSVTLQICSVSQDDFYVCPRQVVLTGKEVFYTLTGKEDRQDEISSLCSEWHTVWNPWTVSRKFFLVFQTIADYIWKP